jgi:nicotinate phosphoribosyltransferase
MAHSSSPYGSSLSLLTDLYQLTMACGYWKAGIAEREAVFDLTFRSHPFDGGFSIACGAARVVEYLNALRFDEGDRSYLKGLKGSNDERLFDDAFLGRLRDFELRCDVDGIPEGTAVFPHEPLLRVQGPLWQAQLLETALLNIVNFETLIATKAARVALAAEGEPVLEFGLRRAQGVDGGLAASRAAYIGGCAGTSNVLAGKRFGIPVKGTHAHSWVMAFDSEMESFEAYADAMPGNAVLLVDTYDTIQGIRRAIEVGKKLRKRGHQLAGIRLDSGDLAALSIDARRMLDEAGFSAAAIVGSGDLDEHAIAKLKSEGAKISVWGVGTKLSTGHDDSALGGVYKLSAIRDSAGAWQYKVKLSEQTAKMSNPGILQVRRFRVDDRAVADVVFDVPSPPKGRWVLVEPLDSSRRTTVPQNAAGEDLLVPFFRAGRPVFEPPSATEARQRTLAQIAQLDRRFTRLTNPDTYPAGLDQGLFETKQEIIARIKHGELQQTHSPR